MQKHEFIYDLMCQSDMYNVGIASAEVYGASIRDVDAIHIPHRNGDVLNDNGCYHNRKIVYHCWIAHTFLEDFEKLRDDLMMRNDGTYKYLSDTFDTTHTHLARLESISEPDTKVRRRVGEFDIVFDCKPQRYRKDSLTWKTVTAGAFNNPTYHPAYPLLKITGKGTVGIDNQTITVLPECPYNEIWVDCETMDAYANGDNENDLKNCNNYVTLPLDNIVLRHGSNNISLSGCTLEMCPNWYDL